MNAQQLVKTSAILLVACGAMIPLHVEAFPFETTPEGFTSYLNGLTWRDGSTYTFFNPRDCGLRDISWGYVSRQYDCGFDYEEKSSLGTRTCIGSTMMMWEYTDTSQFIDNTPPGIRIGDPRECSAWEQSLPPKEPQQTEVLAPAPNTSSTATSSKPREIPLIGLGACLVLLGGGLGFLLSKLINRK
jgi:hypothetical protein